MSSTIFCVVYEFIVNKSDEKRFVQLWRDLTIEVRDNHGALGSRLHRVSDESTHWIAYAQWPDRVTWEKHAPLNSPTYVELREQMQDLCREIKTLYQLDMVDDLLLPLRA